MLHVIIVNYNTASHIRRCVESINDTSAVIHVFDNASPARSEIEELEDLTRADPRIELTRYSANLGFAGAVNHALSAAQICDGDDIWILNPDIIVKTGAITALRSALDNCPNSVISPVISTGPGNDIWFAGGQLDLTRGYTRHLVTRPSSATPVVCTFLTGAALMMRGSTWKTIGGFRDDLFLYWEDADLSLRATRNGTRLLVIPDAEVWHAVGASTGSDSKSPTWYYYMARNRLIVCGSSMTRSIDLLLGRGILPTTRLLGRIFRERGSRRSRLVALSLGLCDGLRRHTGQWQARSATTTKP